MEWLGKELGYTKEEDWYKVQRKHFLENHGKTLLNRKSNSPYQILTTVFPDYRFLPWKFDRTPGVGSASSLETDEELRKDLQSYIANALSIQLKTEKLNEKQVEEKKMKKEEKKEKEEKETEEWKRVTLGQLRAIGLGSLVQSYGGLSSFIEKLLR